MRVQAGITEPPPCLRVVDLDFEYISLIDVTGLQALKDAKADLKMFAGEDFELQFLGLNKDVMLMFQKVWVKDYV